jgi:signal transduction histidine kinase
MSSGSDSSERPPRAPLAEATGLGGAEREGRLAFFDIGTEDGARLLAFRDVALATVDDLVARFYRHLLAFAPLADLLHAEPGRIPRLQGLQRAYFLEITEGRFDEAYFESRRRVGDAHQRLGVAPMWYIGAFALYLRLALRALVAARGEGESVLPQIESLVKAVFLDMSLAIDTYIYGGFVDRTVAEKVEEARQVAEEALAARGEVERLKDDLTSMVVHDLKNPVSGISMMVQLALRKAGDMPDPQRSYLHQIDRTCREMMRLIQNLLEISKIEEGKMPVAREPIVLAELADEIGREYGSVAEQTGRRLAIAVDTALPAAAADRALLKRVLVNLVVNGIRHSGSQEVRLEASTGPTSGEIIIRVVDHGHGIRPEDQARIFDKFRTIRRSPSDDPSTDTGLGLPFCRLAVQHMGGRIGVESAPGAGTVFSVVLPVHVP